MRRLTKTEVKKRGCEYCAHHTGRWNCPYEECPYKVLDKYSTYGQFLKSKDSIVYGLEIWNGKPRQVGAG